MKRIAAAKFKEQCLSILDRLGPEGVIVTKHGKPVAKVLPLQQASAELIGALRAHIAVNGDLTTTRLRWDAGA
jgi:antitoxin (DNA-binding transcriptional repressor) of toxin-antitoxin stability system